MNNRGPWLLHHASLAFLLVPLPGLFGAALADKSELHADAFADTDANLPLHLATRSCLLCNSGPPPGSAA